MKKIIFIYFALIFIAISANAQVPGYLGKRFMVGYGLFINTNFDRIYGNSDKEHSPLFRFRHNFSLDYVTGRKSVIGMDIDLNNLYYNYLMYGYDTTALGTIIQTEKKATANISGISYGLHYTTYGIFKHNPVAPLGDYLRFKLFMLNYSTDSREGNYSKIGNKYFNTPGISVGYGQTRVLFDAAVLDYGLEWSWLLKNKYYASVGDNKNMLNTEYYALNELFWYYFVNFKIGVSGLIF